MNKQLHILLLWEGPTADGVRNRLKEEFAARWQDKHERKGWSLKLHDVQQFSPTADKGYLNRVHTLVKKCDCAIALQAYHSRIASNGAGNLWLEVGIWIARNGPHNLAITCKQETEDKDSSQYVKPPSNFDGAHHIDYVEDEKLFDALDSWLGECFVKIADHDGAEDALMSWRPSAKYASTDDERIDRVRETCGEPAAAWLAQHLQICKETHGRGDCTSDALTFVAELLRMGKAARELSDVSSALNKIANAAEAAANSKVNSVTRQAMQNLGDALDDLVTLANNQLRRPGRPEERDWKRIQSYLEFRLERFECEKRNVRELHGQLPNYITCAAELWDPEQFARPDYRPDKPLAPGKRNQLGWMFKYSRDVADLLDRLRTTWLNQTSDTMKAHFKQFSSQHRPEHQGIDDKLLLSLGAAFHQLGLLSRALPHNRWANPHNGWPIRIWSTDLHQGGES
jgi:hypothetical protein